jgi:hypothetical protein
MRRENTEWMMVREGGHKRYTQNNNNSNIVKRNRQNTRVGKFICTYNHAADSKPPSAYNTQLFHLHFSRPVHSVPSPCTYVFAQIAKTRGERVHKESSKQGEAIVIFDMENKMYAHMLAFVRGMMCYFTSAFLG